MTHHDPSPWAMGAVVAVVALSYVRERAQVAVSRLRERFEGEDRDALEELNHRFETTDMSVAEFERRLEDLMDPCDEEMRRRLEDVEDVGDVVATEVAVRFDSVEHVRQADRHELEDVPHVGPSRADSIAEFFE